MLANIAIRQEKIPCASISPGNMRGNLNDEFLRVPKMHRDLSGNVTNSDWLEWNRLISEAEGLVTQHKLQHSVIFHGTTSHVVDDVERNGLRPTMISHARFTDEDATQEQELFRHLGSFWGTVETAAWYARSGVIDRHGYGKPVLLSALTNNFGNEFPLLPDKSSALSPIDARSTMHDPIVLNRWLLDGHQRGWRDALDEIGAVYAVHHERIPKSMFCVISSIDDLISMLEMQIETPEVGPPRW